MSAKVAPDEQAIIIQTLRVFYPSFSVSCSFVPTPQMPLCVGMRVCVNVSVSVSVCECVSVIILLHSNINY